LVRIGVLALQGDFAEHAQALREVGVETREVRLPSHLEGLDGLVIPGGESTTIRRLMDLYHLTEPLVERLRQGWPCWGTCAGMILLARRLADSRPQPLGIMDIEVARNAFGRQVDSFEADLEVPALGPQPFRAVFIRAPVVLGVGEGAEPLARLEDGRVVAVRQGNLLATAFHPELTPDRRFHHYFLGLVRSHRGEG